MRSARPDPAIDRILEAAMRQFADHGYRGGSVRAIAADAGTSPALVLHHYGSKDGLRRACDQRLMEVAADKEGILLSGQVPTVGEYLAEHPESVVVLDYLRRAMSDGGAVATELFDRLHTETVRLLRLGQEAGTVRAADDLHGAAAILTAWSLGALLMSDDLGRALGGTSLYTEPAAERYSRAGLDVLTHGLLTLPGASAPHTPDETEPTGAEHRRTGAATDLPEGL